MGTVTKGEVEGILRSMQKDKISGLDGWTVEFFQHFFETTRDEITRVVEESRVKGSI